MTKSKEQRYHFFTVKRLITALLLFVFLFFIILPVPVQGVRPLQATPSFQPHPRYSTESAQERLERLQHFREMLQARKAAIQERIETHRATVAARIAARRITLIERFFDRMVRRIEAAIARLNGLIARIESRIDRIGTEDEDIDTSAVEVEVETAKDKLASASAAFNEAKTSLDDILDSEDPKEEFASLRDLIKEIKYGLMDVHTILVHLIGDIRGLRVGVTEGGLPTPATPSSEGE